MSQTKRWTSSDLEVLPDDGQRYEIIGGDLYVSRQPSLGHQQVCGQAFSSLQSWSRRSNLGRAFFAPGLVFAEDDDVAPDVVWISQERLAADWGKSPHLHVAPEIVVEVLSPGLSNQQRDRQTKLRLYSRRGVEEYWILDWQARLVEVYRRSGDVLLLVQTLRGNDHLTSPILPGYSTTPDELFAGLPE